MNVRIRPVWNRDKPALRQIFLDARHATFTWRDPLAFALADFDAQTIDEDITVALDADTSAPIGFISVYQPDAFIHHLYIKKQYTRRGVGKTLLLSLPDFDRRPYRLKCLHQNTAASAFYKAVGFHDIGHGISPEGPYDLLESRRG